MNWRRKAQIQNVVAALPQSDAIYFALQRAMGSWRAGRAPARDWLEAAAMLADWVEGAGRTLDGGRVVEVGTGRSVTLPVALWLCGAARVVTVDLNRYLARAPAFESLDYLRERGAEVAHIFGPRAESAEFRARLARLKAFRGSLAELLRLTNVEYLAPADARSLPLEAHTFDFHVSHAVLEHVPAEVLPGILSEARRLLAPGGLLYHVIDPSDHFSHDDASITAVNFLQFGEGEWRRLAGNKFMFHNRLRSYEFQELFARAGVRVVRQQETTDEPSLRALRDGFPLDARFRDVAPEALAVRSLNVLGTFDEEE